MLIDDMIKIYDYDIYNNSEITEENINILAKEIFENHKIDFDKYFDFQKCSNKFCWKNYIRIFEASSNENREKGISGMVILLQDTNWPVYNDAFSFLMQFESETLEPYIKEYVKQAYKEDDEMWIDNIKLLAKKKNINL